MRCVFKFMLTDYHVHIENGDYNLSWIKKFINTAEKKEINELGISEHSHLFKETKDILTNDWLKTLQTKELNDYLNIIQETNNNIKKIKLGIEMDYVPGKEKETEKFLKSADFDYVIGSIHWINGWGFDIPEMEAKWYNSNLENIYKNYFRLIGELAQTQLFDIIGHFDVIKVFGHQPEPYSKELLKIIEDAVLKIKENNMCVEINTAGLRKPVKEIYPKREWLQLFCEAKVPLILSSDAHYPEEVGADFEKAVAMAKNVGYQKTAVFEKRSYYLSEIP